MFRSTGIRITLQAQRRICGNATRCQSFVLQICYGKGSCFVLRTMAIETAEPRDCYGGQPESRGVMK